VLALIGVVRSLPAIWLVAQGKPTGSGGGAGIAIALISLK